MASRIVDSTQTLVVAPVKISWDTPKFFRTEWRKPGSEYEFKWAKPGFPGTVIAGRFADPFSAGPGNVKVYLTIGHQASGNQLRPNRHPRIRLLYRQLRRA